jgi:hypothetical protein
MTTHHDCTELRVKVGVGEEGVSWEMAYRTQSAPLRAEAL